MATAIRIAHPLEHGRRLGICGLRLAVNDVRTKFEDGGNVDDEHRQAVAVRLAERGGPGDTAALRHLADPPANPPRTSRVLGPANVLTLPKLAREFAHSRSVRC